MKLLPVKVRVKAALPAFTLAGEMLAREGTGLLTVRVTTPDVPPPGAGFATVTDSDPAAAISLAGMVAVSCVLLTKVVVRLDPFTLTTEPDMKLLPVKVRVNAAPPAFTLAGEMLAREGAGL